MGREPVLNYSFDDVEHTSLRHEILVRILIQNLIILSAIVLFNITLIGMIIVPHEAKAIALAYGLTSGAAALGWCHNGVRQAQIKSYLLMIEAQMSPRGGWETWLPRNRIGGILGTRWFIATKGVFIGSQLIAAGMSFVMATTPADSSAVLLVLPIAATVLILLINPKERGPVA